VHGGTPAFPTIVVNFFHEGDLLRVVNNLNGV
jgi:hypothetical protein